MDNHKNIVRARNQYVRLARDYGLTLEAIGDALGITEGAVRLILKQEGE